MKVLKYINQKRWLILLHVKCIILGILLFIISLMICRCKEISDLIKNLGYGILSAAFLSCLITYKECIFMDREDKIVFENIMYELKSECENLLVEVHTCALECVGYEYVDKHTYEEWINMIFSFKEDNDKKMNEIEYIIQQVGVILNKSKYIHSLFDIYHKNLYFSDEERKLLEKLQSTCRRININLKKNNFDACKKILIGDLKNDIVLLFDDLEVDFNKKYNENDYM